MILTALDLSLGATGLFHGDPQDPTVPYVLGEIATPDRRRGESDVAWNARRFDRFSGMLLQHLERFRPRLLVLEVTSHAHRTTTRDGVRTTNSRGQEFLAGLGLGRALGWIDGTLVLASAYGYGPTRVETIEAGIAKLRVAGNQGASKLAVKNKLAELFGWATDDWRESQVDALMDGLGWARETEMAERERAIRQVAEAQSARRPPIRPVGGRGTRQSLRPSRRTADRAAPARPIQPL